MATSLGLHIDSHSLKAVVVTGNERAARVTSFVNEPLVPDGKYDAIDLPGRLRDFFERHKLPKGQVVASVGTLDAVLRDVAVPQLNEAHIRQTITFQAESYFHSVSIEDYVVQFTKYAEIDNRSRLLVAGVKKASLEARLGLLEQAGIDPISIDLDVAALANAYLASGLCEEHPLVTVVRLEHNHLHIAVIERGRLRTARSIRKRFGGAKVKAEAGEGASRLPVVILDEGDDEDSFSLEDSGITTVQRDGYLNGIFREIDKTIALSHTEEPLGFMCLTGASCDIEGIEAQFEEHFEVEARRVDLAEVFAKGAKTGLGDLSLEAAVPLGLALKGLGVDRVGMDFRQQEYAYHGRFDKLKKGVACSLCLIFVLCFLYAFELKQQARMKKDRVYGIQMMQKSVFTVLFPATPEEIDSGIDHKELLSTKGYYAALNEEHGRLDGVFGGAVTKKVVTQSVVDILREFSSFKARCRARIEVTSARISQESTRIHCVSDLQQASVLLARQLEKSKMFKADTERITAKGDAWEFDVVLELISEEQS